MHLFVLLCVCLNLCVSPFVCVSSLSVSHCMCVSFCVCNTVCLSLSLCVSLYVCLTVFVSHSVFVFLYSLHSVCHLCWNCFVTVFVILEEKHSQREAKAQSHPQELERRASSTLIF